ncbi:uncharacterized protein V6R79_000127 [Siganus canaliculatus]
MAESQKATEPTNFVHQDENWKARIKLEKDSAKVWTSKWGVLMKAYKQYQKDSVRRTEAQTRTQQEAQPAAGPVQDQVGPLPPVPQTSQAFIGWCCSQPRLCLEKMKHPRQSYLSLSSCSLEAGPPSMMPREQFPVCPLDVTKSFTSSFRERNAS